MITQQELKEVLFYDPITGVFTWRQNIIYKRGVAKGAVAKYTQGKRAGGVEHYGYRRIKINGKTYKEHRLAWLYMYGAFPPHIDHKDGVRDNNRIENLRLATNSQNACNRSKSIKNTSGYKGVDFSRASKKWRARIMKNGKRITVGYYDTPEEAAENYRIAAKEIHGAFYTDR